MNMDYHTTAIDIADLQVRCFHATRPGAVERHQENAVEREFGCVDQPRKKPLSFT